jgi:hypothetical protein
MVLNMNCAFHQGSVRFVPRFVVGLWLAAAAFCLTWTDAKADAGDEDPWQFVLMVTGRSAKELPHDSPEKLQSMLEQMQGEHLGNFGKLASQQLLSAAGPLGDPERKLRGICVVRAADEKALGERFTNDPFVREGLLKLEPQLLTPVHGEFKLVLEPSALEEYRLVILEADAADLDAAAVLRQMQTTYPSLLAATLGPREGCSRRGFAIYPKVDDQAVTDAWSSDPSVASGKMKLRIMPLFLSRGALPE